MIGDVNLFLTATDNDDEETPQNEVAPNLVGEVEIMIAPKASRGKGLGKAVLSAFLWYVVTNLTRILAEYDAAHHRSESVQSMLKYLRVKVGAENTTSIRLFEIAGFKKISDTPNYFGEMELRRSVGNPWTESGETKVVPMILRYGDDQESG
jgi:RimJ/RimL family protein N-acetyltransferase